MCSMSGVSFEADQIQNAGAGLQRSVEESHSLFGAKAKAIEELNQLALDCSQPNWDGYDAVPISMGALVNAEAFIRALPSNLPLPEFCPEPDGSISVDWIVSRLQLLSLSISGSNRIAYAWLDGTDKGHAVARFDGVTVPQRIVEAIRSTVRSSHVAIGAA